MILTKQNVDSVLIDCLADVSEDYQPSEDQADGESGVLIITGCMNKFAFSKEKLAKNQENILTLLGQLPISFRVTKIGGDGGMSLLNGPMDINGKQWGEQIDADHLFALGQGIGVVIDMFPIGMRSALPGGMPYYAIREVREAKE